MNDRDAVNHWDLPVTEFRPQNVTVKSLEPMPAGVTLEADIEQAFFLRRRVVIVYDFYRHRPDRAEVVRKYA